MAIEHDYCIISKDESKLGTLYNFLVSTEQPEGVCIYDSKLEKHQEYWSLMGILRHTILDELEEEIRKSGVILTQEDYFIVHYECMDEIYLMHVDNCIEIVSDWYPQVIFTKEGLLLPEEIRSIIQLKFGSKS